MFVFVSLPPRTSRTVLLPHGPLIYRSSSLAMADPDFGSLDAPADVEMADTPQQPTAPAPTLALEDRCFCHWGLVRWTKGILEYVCCADSVFDPKGMYEAKRNMQSTKDGRSDCCFMALIGASSRGGGTIDGCAMCYCAPCALMGQLLCCLCILPCCRQPKEPCCVWNFDDTTYVAPPRPKRTRVVGLIVEEY